MPRPRDQALLDDVLSKLDATQWRRPVQVAYEVGCTWRVAYHRLEKLRASKRVERMVQPKDGSGAGWSYVYRLNTKPVEREPERITFEALADCLGGYTYRNRGTMKSQPRR